MPRVKVTARISHGCGKTESKDGLDGVKPFRHRVVPARGVTPHLRPVVIDGVLHCRHCHQEWPCEPNIIAARMVAAVLGIEINTR